MMKREGGKGSYYMDRIFCSGKGCANFECHRILTDAHKEQAGSQRIAVANMHTDTCGYKPYPLWFGKRSKLPGAI